MAYYSFGHGFHVPNSVITPVPSCSRTDEVITGIDFDSHDQPATSLSHGQHHIPPSSSSSYYSQYNVDCQTSNLNPVSNQGEHKSRPAIPAKKRKKPTITNENTPKPLPVTVKPSPGRPSESYSIEEHMACLLFWKLSKYEAPPLDGSSRKSGEPQHNERYVFVCEQFKNRYNKRAPQYKALKDREKLFDNNEPILKDLESTVLVKKADEHNLTKVRHVLEEMKPNALIAPLELSRKLKMPAKIVRQIVHSETDLVVARTHYFRRPPPPKQKETGGKENRIGKAKLDTQEEVHQCETTVDKVDTESDSNVVSDVESGVDITVSTDTESVPKKKGKMKKDKTANMNPEMNSEEEPMDDRKSNRKDKQAQLNALAQSTRREHMTFEQKWEVIRYWQSLQSDGKRGQKLMIKEKYNMLNGHFMNKYGRPAPHIKYVYTLLREGPPKPREERRGRKFHEPPETIAKIHQILEETNGLIPKAQLAKRVNLCNATLERILNRRPEFAGKLVMPTAKKDYDHYKKLIIDEKTKNPSITRQEIVKNIGISYQTLYTWLRRDQELANVVGFKPAKGPGHAYHR